MKTTLFKYAAWCTVLFLCFTKSHAQALPISSYGVWDRGGQITDFSNPNVDFVMGIEESVKWEAIEHVKGTFDFSILQTAIDKAYVNNKLIRLSVEIGPDSPLWIYDNDTNPNNNLYPQVQKVYTNDGNAKPAWPFYPEYLSQTYQDYLWLFLNQFSNFIRSQPQEKFTKIAFVQVKTGCTGDEVPYKGLNPTVVITDQQWHDFRLAVFGKYKEYFNDVPNKKVVLTFNDIDPADPNELYAWNWLNANIDPSISFGIKGGAFNRGHHLSGEQNYKNSLYNYLVNPTGLKLFSGSEMDGTTQSPYFQICEDMSYYWAALGGINVGLSTNNLNAVAMDYATNNPIGRETFRMFTRYAQQLYPATSTTAFSIFHDGLNAEDINRFPESTYGQKRMDNQARYQAICDDPIYYNRGARMNDLVAATKGQVYQRANQTGLNDSGFGIAEGNIERFITQIDPNNTSIGLFRVRGAITTTSSKYDRFARSFECQTNKNKMFFQVHSEFPANNKVLKFTIIWLDRNIGGTWAFQYRNANGLQSRSFTGTGGDIWKTETFTLSDAIINQGGERGSDFMLVNTDGNNQTGKQFDDIFNGIEMNIIGNKQSQTINFNAIPDKKIGDPDFTPGATTNSGLTISYASSNEQVANFVNGKIHLVGIGSTTITASQAGNNTYESASVSQELRVAVVNQTTITTVGTSTWSSPLGVNKITVECWGAGGGGGGAFAQCVGGGAAGGSYVTNTLAVNPNTSYSLTIGAGGIQATGVGTNGLTGGNTRFEWTTPLIANGGVGGFGSGVPAPLVARAGLGGTNLTGGSGGTVILGSSGSAGAIGTSLYGGAGGSSGNSLNTGAAAKTTVGAGNRAAIPGGGGSGAFGPASPATTGNNRGGTGAAGQVKISYILSVPDAPVIVVATATGLSGEASVSFTAPTFDGNATITSYTATASPGGRTATINQSGSGSITITGLTNGTAYTFTVRAINSIGQSASSAGSNVATPIRTIQNIVFNTIPTKSFGEADFNAAATASSALAVSYTSSNLDVARIENGLIQIIGVGTVSITAYQEGDGTYSPATPVSQQLTVIKANQSISFNALPTKTFGDADFSGGAKASSGLAVTYYSSDETIAKIVNGSIQIVGAGTCRITASQAGNGTYNAATSVYQDVTFVRANQTISFGSLPTRIFGDVDFGAGATASSGLPVTYYSSDETVAKIVNGSIQIVGTGAVSITASQVGNINYNAATLVYQDLVVVRANQSISYEVLPSKTFGDMDFSAGAVASSGLGVSYSSSDDLVAVIVNGTIKIVGVGTAIITASQAGNGNYNPASLVSQQLTVAKANQNISFNALPNKTFGGADFTAGATSNSELAISYTSSDNLVATIVNGAIRIVGVGTATITASQAGNENYNAASSISQPLTVSKANQTITFGSLPSKISGDADFSLEAAASSGLAVSYNSSNEAVATIVNGVIRIVGAGNSTITASQAGNSSYNVATPVTQLLKVLTVIRTVITTAGTSTWTCPAGVTSIKVEAWGGGGSGGSTSTGGLGGGGAGGSYVAHSAVSVVPGSSYALTVGAGGIPSSNGNSSGTAGGATTFASTLPVVANGGAFGNKAIGTGTLNTAFGLGGTNTNSGSGGTTYALGTNGSNATFGNSGSGGNGAGLGGAGGARKTSSGVGLPGAVPGGGGSGSFAALTGGRAGGAGGAGQIIITYNAEVSNPSARFKPSTIDNTLVSDESKQFKIYPNPVAAYSEFGYNLLEEGKVQLNIFALNGQLVQTLIDNEMQLPGNYKKIFDGSKLVNGVYIAQLKTANEIKTIKVVLKK